MRIHSLILFLLIPCIGFGQQKSVLVCLGKSSYAYHDHYCQGLKQCKASVEEVTIEEAVKLNRKPCGYCYKQGGAPQSSSNKSPAENNGQCKAITKKGSRCSRAAKSNGYCWQHGG